MNSILVNYTGGFCGSFFASLVAESLNLEHISSTEEEKNLYFFNSLNDIDVKHIKMLGKLFEIKRGELDYEDLKCVAKNKLDDFYTMLFSLYNILRDPDDDKFFENMKDHYKDLMKTQKKEFFVATIHYAFYYKNNIKFSIHEIFPDSSVLHVISENKRHGRYFNMLFHYKSKDNVADQALQLKTLSRVSLQKEIINPRNPSLSDIRSIPVDMGKLVFERDFNHLKEIELNLSNKLQKEVVFDRDRFNKYADKNVEIIKSILGNDFENQSEKEQIKKSLDYIQNKVRINGR